MQGIHVIDRERPDLGGNFRGGDNAAFTPALWRYLIDRFALRSVLDIGCGEGYAVGFFHRIGLHAHGIDGLALNVERAVVPVAQHDLTRGAYRMPVDLVTCIEVAEHIAEPHVDHLLDTLANGRVICMTAAPPGQHGYHHVNCQPVEYWVERLGTRGYLLSHENEIFRRIAASEADMKYFTRSGMVFLRH